MMAIKTDDLSLIKSIKDEAYTEGDFTTRAGKKTSFYIDKYLFETNPDILGPLTKRLATLFPDPSSYDRIIAPALGAIALASHLSLLLWKPFNIYSVQKGQACLTDRYQADDRVIIIEDVLTTGSTVIDVCNYVKTIPFSIVKIISVIDREEGAMEALTERGFDAQALIKASDFSLV